MDTPVSQLDTLPRARRRALRALLVKATAVAGNDVSDDDIAELSALARAAPIMALPDAAALHRVSGSVLRGLEGVEHVPPAVRAALARSQHGSAMQHLHTIAALSLVAKRFDAAGLEWVVMKGPVVACLLYPSVGERSYGDLDLLVGRRDFGRAVEILEELGYEHHIHDWALAEQMMAGEIGMSSALAVIDLHWHFHYSDDDRKALALPVDAMVGRRRRVVCSGVATPTFDAVDTLLTLAFHAARSDGHRLLWFKDIERSVVVERPDFDEVVRRAHDYRIAGPVGLMLARTRALLDAPIPPDVVGAMLPWPLRSLDRLATSIVAPTQLHERPTMTRLLTRSVRTSLADSVVAIPSRALSASRRAVFPTTPTESDDPDEKSSFLVAVATADEP